MSNKISRRDFLKQASLGLAGLTIVPSSVLGSAVGKVAPSDKLNIAGIGIGGRGAAVIKECVGQNIVALCDVDWKYASGMFEQFPKAERFKDYRVMFDKLDKSIDAVVIATPDHTHAVIAAQAMEMGKHVLCEKPLTHSVYESRLLSQLSIKNRVATQMGNQGASEEGVRKICKWIWNGEIGEVKRVEAFTDRPIWKQGLTLPTDTPAVPGTLDWDLFLGPAKERPYHPLYTPWNWRGWWDFGTGALGDMACHVLHPVFKALDLMYPIKVEATSTPVMTESAPNAEMVKYVFPKRKSVRKIDMPEVEVIWYDGGLMPQRPDGLPAGKNLNIDGGGVIFYGTKDTLVCGAYGRQPYLLSGREPGGEEVLRVVEWNHTQDWIRACKESAANRIEPVSCFKESGPFNEMVVMGVLAVRLQGLNKTLEWDGKRMEFTNITDNEEVHIMVKDGFTIHDGHPSFNKSYATFNAKQFAQEMIKHNYRAGWSLPEMPNYYH